MIELTEAATGNTVALNPRLVEVVRNGRNNYGSRIFTSTGNTYDVTDDMGVVLVKIRQDEQDRTRW